MKDLIALTTKGFLDGYRYIIHEGGTRSGKTHSVLTTLFHVANSRPSITSVVSETFPHLRKGAIRDYQRILQSQNAWDEKLWNKTDSTHAIRPNHLLEFFSADNSDKVHGPERDYLFINEGQNIPWEIVNHLFVRTRKTIFIDFNPTREFWAHTELKNDPRALWIHSTYKDNPFLTPEQVQEIERNKKNKTWWIIYGEGRIAESEGAVYRNWQQIDEIPHEARLERRGLDFGYTNDPSALVDVYYYNGGYIWDEQLYQKGMSNKQIADVITSLDSPQTLVIADSAEPKSIDELKLYGVNVLPSQKGPGSILQGIQFVQDQRISVTKRSTNILKEYRNYLWEKDKRTEQVVNVPSSSFNHCFTGDTKISTSGGDKDIKDIKTGDLVYTSRGLSPVTKIHDNGIKEVSVYWLHTDTQSVKIVATPDHRVRTGNTWTEISKLKTNQTINLLSTLEEKDTLYMMVRGIFPEAQERCIGMCGSFITENARRVLLSITRMAIPTTIKLKTLLQCPPINIKKYTESLGRSGSSRRFNRSELSQRKDGIEVEKVGHGTRNTGKGVGKVESTGGTFARYVKKLLCLDTRARSNIVMQTVKLRHLEKGESYKARVYDLTVRNTHEYFANGVLVHNCMDAGRYAMESLRPYENEELPPDDTGLFGGDGFY